MTREEAILHMTLRRAELTHSVSDLDEDIKAFDMAIEALSTEPCEDCISRAELLKAIDTWDKFGCDANTKLVPYQDRYVPYIHYDDAVKCIKGMPSVTPKQRVGRWIPIKTRPMTEEEKEHHRELGWDDAFLDTIYDCDLPEDGQTVLITTRYGEVQTDTFYADVEGALFETYSDVDDVLAWMPLPEPYKAESEDK